MVLSSAINVNTWKECSVYISWSVVDYDEPYAIVVLLSSDLIFVDMTTPGWVEYLH